MQQREGYTTVALDKLVYNLDALKSDYDDHSRSHTLRRILKRYFDLKTMGIDILTLDADKIKKELKKL